LIKDSDSSLVSNDNYTEILWPSAVVPNWWAMASFRILICSIHWVVVVNLKYRWWHSVV